uniref:KIB1-4 beta-propeller domain-containing protein n=1 Tax=Noccaea caerulescens TaxID=107243 RepID=A0A1J3EW48_NOCCA
MRSLLLSRLSKLSSLRKLPVVLGVRFLSETPPCHILGAAPCGSNSRDGEIGRLVVSNYTESCWSTMTHVEKKVPMSLMTETGTIGASRGWVATLKDGVVCFQDDLIPSASDSEPKRISLPPLQTLPHCQTQLVTNVAMSSGSPDKDEDCILAVKFLGPQLSLCRPALGDKAEWFNIRVTDPGFFSSRVMYSKRDNMFSMAGSGGKITGSWDLEKHILVDTYFPFYPEFVQSHWDRLCKSCRSEHLVESPSGETFFVKWYTQRSIHRDINSGKALTERFLVFSVSNNKMYRHTRDIGDNCIFLSAKGEPFCLQASLYGLSRNCIYFVGRDDFGEVNIADDVIMAKKTRTSRAPYFIPPPS